MHRTFRLFVILLIVGLVAVGCAAPPAAQAPAQAEEAAPAEEAAVPAAEGGEEIVVGAIYPLSGSLAATGVDLKNAVELATDIINNEYDLNLPLAQSAGLPNMGGAKIRLALGDHEADPEKGAAEAERLINEGAAALVGSYNSAVTATASQVAEREGVPFLNPESTSPTLTERGFQWFFRTTPYDKLFAENFFQFLDDMKAKGYDVSKVAILNENTLWGTDVSDLENQYAEQYGYNVAANIPYEADASEVTSEVQKLKAAGDDAALLQASYVSDAILYMQTYKQLDYAPQAIIAMDAGFVASEFVDTLGDDANYILSREVWALDLAESKPIIKAVNDMYKERYGTDMNGNSARAFTGMLVLADAINRAGSTDPTAIQQALMETDIPADQIIMPWKGIKFDPETHQNTLGSGIIVQIQDGEYKTVWPFDLASAEIVWPFPKWSER